MKRIVALLMCAAASSAVRGQTAAPADSPGSRPHAASATRPFRQSDGVFTLEYPADWDAHESGSRVTIGPPDGLVASERGFRTVYGAIAVLADDPAGGKGRPSVVASTTAVVDAVLARNPHQHLQTPVHDDGVLADQPAASAVLVGTSPVTGHGERAEIVCRQYGDSQIFYLILVSPTDQFGILEKPLQQLRASVRIGGRR